MSFRSFGLCYSGYLGYSGYSVYAGYLGYHSGRLGYLGYSVYAGRFQVVLRLFSVIYVIQIVSKQTKRII
jgi:hypothetical protein